MAWAVRRMGRASMCEWRRRVTPSVSRCLGVSGPACIVCARHSCVVVYVLGVGAQRGRDDDWLEQQAAFEEVLSQLHLQHPQGGGQEGVSSCLSVCLCVCVLHINVMSVCSAFKESSQWRERRGGRAKLFDQLGCCFTTPNVSTPCLQHAGHMCVTWQVT